MPTLVTAQVTVIGCPASAVAGAETLSSARSGYNVVYGSASKMKQKNEVLQAVATDVNNNKRKIAYIDVRVPDSPVIKPQ